MITRNFVVSGRLQCLNQGVNRFPLFCLFSLGAFYARVQSLQPLQFRSLHEPVLTGVPQ
jgi:hypothetical protein